jgi:polyribonucleotide nucleotidyltransferase
MRPQGIKKTIDMGDGKVITIETGVLAKQADGAVTVRLGDTILLATVVATKEAREIQRRRSFPGRLLQT